MSYAEDDEIIAACREQAYEALVDVVDSYIALVAPETPLVDRWDVSREIAKSIRPGESVEEACRRYGREFERSIAKNDLVSARLRSDWSKNDMGNGEQFTVDNADRLKYLVDRDVWVRWDGRRWNDATEEEIAHYAKFTVKNMIEAAFAKPEEDSKEERKHAMASTSKSAVYNMITLAKSEKALWAKVSEFDTNLDLLNVSNGSINLRTGEMREHNRADLITTVSSIKYDPEAKCPRWEQFLLKIFNNDTELVEFVQRAVGYSMTGHTREQAFFILHGGGRNGKGRFIAQLSALMGDAARTTGFTTFTQQKNSSDNTPALASLAGARLVTAGEPDHGVKLSESTIKSLTGEDEIEVCNKYEKPFRYTPLYKIWIHCNHKPVIRGTDNGIWERPRLIPFLMSFMTKAEAEKKGVPEHMRRDPDRKLDAKLNAERSGILAWAVRGAMKWYIDGLGRSKTMESATDEYRVESDTLAPFLDEVIKREPGKFASNERIFAAYEAWCRRNLIDHVMSGQTLSKQLVSRGFEKGRSEKSERGFKNISLIQSASLFSIPAAPPAPSNIIKIDVDKKP